MSIPSTLVRQSNLTEKQFESLVSYIKVVTGEMRYREAAASRSGKPVTIGAYYRTVQQGRNQIRMSIVTVLVAVATGLVNAEDVRKLFEVIGRENAVVAEEDKERFSAVLRTLLDRIVM